MDEWLAQIYGTGAADDLEKTAQAHFLEKLAEMAASEGIDIDSLTDEEVQGLAQEFLGQDAQQLQDPSQAQMQPDQTQQFVPQGALMQQAQPTEQDMAKEAQAKFEEADFLGRVMAHAYTQELEKIAGARDVAGRAAGAARRGASRAYAGARRGASAAGGHFKRNWKSYAAGGGGAAAGFAAGRMSKEASQRPVFEKLAEMRAAEMLEAVGVDPATGQPAQAQPPQQMQQPQQQQEVNLDDALNERALELLAQAGYDPEQVVAALQAAAGQQQGAAQQM